MACAYSATGVTGDDTDIGGARRLTEAAADAGLGDGASILTGLAHASETALVPILTSVVHRIDGLELGVADEPIGELVALLDGLTAPHPRGKCQATSTELRLALAAFERLPDELDDAAAELRRLVWR